MPHLHSLKITNFRNIKDLAQEFTPRFNVVVGVNGSGKTSLLEAIYVLSTGKILQGTNGHALINFSAAEYVVSAQVADDNSLWQLGTRRSHNYAQYKLENQSVRLQEVAKLLPLQVIDMHSQELFTGDIHLRQGFLDWLLFHVEPTFMPLWQNLRKCLRQRNALLKQIRYKLAPLSSLKPWDQELVTWSQEIDAMRQNLLGRIQPFFKLFLQNFGYVPPVDISYQAGWPRESSLEEALSMSLTKDLEYGFTTYGAQRADLLITHNGSLVKNSLSRGQQKILAIALVLGRACWLKEEKNILGTFLVDDLGSELDALAVTRVITALHTLETQVILTSLPDFPLLRVLPTAAKMFHVEQGAFRELAD